MNKQNPGVEWTHVFGPGTGHTWNVGVGCKHRCVWQMTAGSLAECYAKTISDRFTPNDFENYRFFEERLKEPYALKTPAGIFLDSMSDLMGHWVTDEQINRVLEIVRQTPRHIYFLLTKNAPRLTRFDFPPNCWVGVSAPPSQMNGLPLTLQQQIRWFHVALSSLSQCNAGTKWVSFEPLSFDVADTMSGEDWEPLVNSIHWAVIGAASNGRAVYQPDPAWVSNLVDLLDCQNIPVFYKGNLKGNTATQPWREEYPAVEVKPVQGTLW